MKMPQVLSIKFICCKSIHHDLRKYTAESLIIIDLLQPHNRQMQHFMCKIVISGLGI
jgi:hypothetical protein